MMSELVTFIYNFFQLDVMFSLPFAYISLITFSKIIFLSWIILVRKLPLQSPSLSPETFTLSHSLPLCSVNCRIYYSLSFVICSSSWSHFPSTGVSGQPRLREHPVASPERRQHQLSRGHDNLAHHPESQVGECMTEEGPNRLTRITRLSSQSSPELLLTFLCTLISNTCREMD